MFDGREAFEAAFERDIKAKVDLPADVLEHYRKLAINFLWEEDPDHEELEAEKDLVLEESKAAYKRAAEKMAEDEANHPLQPEESSSSDEEEERKEGLASI